MLVYILSDKTVLYFMSEIYSYLVSWVVVIKGINLSSVADRFTNEATLQEAEEKAKKQ